MYHTQIGFPLTHRYQRPLVKTIRYWKYVQYCIAKKFWRFLLCRNFIIMFIINVTDLCFCYIVALYRVTDSIQFINAQVTSSKFNLTAVITSHCWLVPRRLQSTSYSVFSMRLHVLSVARGSSIAVCRSLRMSTFIGWTCWSKWRTSSCR